jgi:ribosomal protein S13
MVMAKNVKHYKRDGTEYTGGTHKMPDGSLHSGKTHGKTSVKLFHFEDLSKTAKEKAMPGYKSTKNMPVRGQRVATNKKNKKKKKS